MTWIQNLLGFFYDILFGCRHWSQTRPFTLEQQTYKVCLDCGKQIYYSRERMTPLSASEVRRMKAGSGPHYRDCHLDERGQTFSPGARISRTRPLKYFVVQPKG